MDSLIAILDAIVKMQVRGGAQALVVQARQAETFLQILLEVVQRLELGCVRRHLLRGRRSPEHLIAAIYQERDFVADQQAGFVDVWMLSGAVFDDGRNSIAS